jgi:drug/metabolite transporter (DMT)-like permease
LTKFAVPKINPYMGFVVLMWAYNFSAVKIAYREMTPGAVTLTRMVGVWLFFVGLCLWRKIPIRYPAGMRNRYLLQGFLANGLYMIFFMEGMKRTSAAEAAIFMAMSPILTNVFSVLSRQEAFRWQVVYGTVIAFAGVMVTQLGADPHGGGSWLGNLLIFCGAATWATAVIVMRPLLSTTGPILSFTLALPGSLVLLVPVYGAAVVQQDWTSISAVGWTHYVHIVWISGGLAFAAFYRGVEQIGASRATMYQFVVPPLAAFLAWIALGEHLSLYHVLGLAIVLAGVLYGARPVPAPENELKSGI